MRLLAVPARGMWPLVVAGHGPYEEQLFCEASYENSHNVQAHMLQAEGIRMPGSKEASFFRRFLKLPNNGFYFGVSFRLRGLYRDKSYNALVAIDTTARYRSVL